MAETVRSITGLATTAGAAEETLPLTFDATVAAASIAVAAGTTLTVGSLHFTSVALANWRIQQSNDGGSTWFDILLTSSPATTVGTTNVSANPGLVVTGGTQVSIRCRVTTPGGAAAVTATLRAYTES